MSKIPQGEWNAIAARYQGGESISNIARSYGCTPPAIHYILKRNRQKPAGISPQPSASAGQLVANGFRPKPADLAGDGTPPKAASSAAGRTAPPVTASTPQDARTAMRNERLSLAAARPALVRARSPEPAANAQSPAPLTQEVIGTPPAAPLSASRETGPGPVRAGAMPPTAFPGLDDALHLRAEAAIALFRSSFDRALVEGSPDVRERLRQAANDLMRVAARTTIVLDRLNATTERSARAHGYPRSAHAGDDLGKFG